MFNSQEFKDGQSAALDVLRRFWADGYYDVRTISFPVDSLDVAGKMNASVQSADFPDEKVIAVLVKDKRVPFPRLIVSKSLDAVGMRYAGAVNVARLAQSEGVAEFGFVDTVQSPVLDDFTRGFVEEFLMPTSIVVSLFGSGKSIRKMVRHFGVSEEILMSRLGSLGLIAAVNQEMLV